MNQEQRKFVSDKLGNLGNFAAVAFVFGQLISQEPIKQPAFFLGVFFWLICMITSYLILRGGEK